jgi:mRNA-degrading endonuclease toxin of MazEF toxin-antitoxin module
MVRPRDTSGAAFERQLEAYRAMSPGERVAIAAAMSDEIRVLAEAGIRDRHPAFSDSQVADALARILLGPELAQQLDRSRPAKIR